MGESIVSPQNMASGETSNLRPALGLDQRLYHCVTFCQSVRNIYNLRYLSGVNRREGENKKHTCRHIALHHRESQCHRDGECNKCTPFRAVS